MTRHEFRRLLNTLPNNLRADIKEVQGLVIKVAEMEVAGEITVDQELNFLRLLRWVLGLGPVYSKR